MVLVLPGCMDLQLFWKAKAWAQHNGPGYAQIRLDMNPAVLSLVQCDVYSTLYLTKVFCLTVFCSTLNPEL